MRPANPYPLERGLCLVLSFGSGQGPLTLALEK